MPSTGSLSASGSHPGAEVVTGQSIRGTGGLGCHVLSTAGGAAFVQAPTRSGQSPCVPTRSRSSLRDLVATAATAQGARRQVCQWSHPVDMCGLTGWATQRARGNRDGLAPAVAGDVALDDQELCVRNLGRMTIDTTWRGTFRSDEVNRLHAEAFATRVFDPSEWNWRGMVDRHSLGGVTARA